MIERRELYTNNAAPIMRMLSRKGHKWLAETDTFKNAFLYEVETTLGRMPDGECTCLGPGIRLRYEADLTFEEWVLLRLKYF